MKYLVLFSVLLFVSIHSNIANAAPSCTEQKATYIAGEGSDAEGTPGKRTWWLQRAAKDLIAHPDDACQKEIYKQALTESKAYWAHIEKKYNCQDAKAETCSEEKRANVEKNKTYIATVENLASANSVCADCGNTNGEPVLSKKNLGNLNATMDVVATQVDGKKSASKDCSLIALSDRQDPNEPIGDIIGSAIPRCLTGLWDGLIKEGLWKLVTNIYDSIYEWRETFSALNTLRLKMADDPKGTFFAMGQNILDYYIERYANGEPNWDCFNAKKKTEVICGYVGKAGYDAIMIALGIKTVKTIVKAGLSVGKAVVTTSAKVVTKVTTKTAAIAMASLTVAKDVATSAYRAGKTLVQTSSDYVVKKYVAAKGTVGAAVSKAALVGSNAAEKAKDIAQTRVSIKLQTEIVKPYQKKIAEITKSMESAANEQSLTEIHQSLRSAILKKLDKLDSRSDKFKRLQTELEIVDTQYYWRLEDLKAKGLRP